MYWNGLKRKEIDMDTKRTLYEIEVALSKHDNFNFIRNIIAFNVNGLSEALNIFHECDMLVLSKAGYLTEIEIKRSWSDFLADFKKAHSHGGNGIIKYFYYCIPKSLLERAYDKLDELKASYTGIITYDENMKITLHGHRRVTHDGNYSYHFVEQYPYRKLFLEEQLQVARFGAMRAIKLKEKLINSHLA
jgi:hypothetical protein